MRSQTALRNLGLITLVISLVIGCDGGTSSKPVMTLEPLPDQPDLSAIESFATKFEPAKRMKTSGGQFIQVESPGYACPTLFDVNGDGQLDLVVGQYASGKMKLFLGQPSEGDSLLFSDADWIHAGNRPAEVPGIS